MSHDQTARSRPLTAKGAATRSRIVEAAANLFYERGVDRTSLDDVMAVSGVSKSQLYHYFADKDALVLAVISAQTGHVLAAQQPHLGALDSLGALQAWRDMIVQRSIDVGLMGCPLGSLAGELANEFPSAREQLAAAFAAWLEQIEKGLSAMRDRGELAPSVDPHELALAVLAAVQGGLLVSKTTRSNRALEAALDMVLDRIRTLTVSPVA